MTQWKTITGFPDYEVSSDGDIFNRRQDRFIHGCLDRTNGYLVVNLYNDDGKPHKRYIHRLVMEAFVPNVNNKRTVNHIDCDKTNNSLDNLEWATDSENMIHAFNNGLCEATRRSAYIQQKRLAVMPRTERQREASRRIIIAANKRPKTERQLEAAKKAALNPLFRERANYSHYDRHPPILVIETGKVYRSQRELSHELGVNESSVCACLHGRSKSAGGYHFRYVSQEVER